MRTAFMKALFDAAAADSRVTLIVGDLGYSVVERFAERYPRQFLNAGIAEQNMTGLAAGMALAGRIVFTYSIANFPTLRCVEQIRNDVCYHRANVKIVAVGGGFAYGALGASHHATEDLAIMRALPGMTVVAPGDPVEAGHTARAVIERDGPAYVRLGKAGEPRVHRGDVAFQLGRAIRVRDGRDVTLVATGGILAIAMEAADRLAEQYRTEARVLSMHTLKPLDEGAVLDAARDTTAVFTVEEHTILGGLGGAVSEVLAEADLPSIRFRRIGLASEFSRSVGSQAHMRQVHGLAANGIAERVMSVLQQANVRAG